jgi:transcription-repair coupling factor (superfamily II helicase)
LENLDQLIELYQSGEVVKNLCELARKQGSHVQLLNAKGSLPAFYFAAASRKALKHQLIISPDKELAAYLYNDLKNLIGDEIVHFLPDSFKRPGNYERFESSNVLYRTELVNKTSNPERAFIIVSYPEALMEKVVSSNRLSEQRISVKMNESLDMETMMDILVEYGFDRTDFVYEPGQFSIRGGIIDIFSFGSEWPYRIELFDDEVESIRLFNPIDQRSIRQLESFSIIPDVNKRFGVAQKTTITHGLAKDLVVVFQDFSYTAERWNKSYSRMIEAANTFSPERDEATQLVLNSNAILDFGEFTDPLANLSIVFLKHPGTEVKKIQKIEVDSSPQPEFNKNFDLLIEDLKIKEQNGMTNFVFAENPKQLERFYAIFEDLEAHVQFVPIKTSLSSGFIDNELKIACYTDHQVFKRFHRYRLKRGFSRSESLNLRLLRELKPGDFVTHIDHGVGRYSGLEKIDINGHIQESIRLIYQNNDLLYVSIHSLHKIAKFSGKDGTHPRLNKLGSDTWQKIKNKTKRKVKDIASELIKLYAKRKAAEAFAFPPDNYLQTELEASFIYEDTPDQETATAEVKEDMCAPSPMDRLICGDVGFGKTEIAVRAAFKAILADKQVVILVPTTILALQHYNTFTERLKAFGPTIDYLNRFRTSAQKTQIYKDLESGKIDLIIGTHSVLNKAIKFKDLGLLIVDEEQKFGVAAKEKLRKLKVNVDTLILTATPIPRTLQFSLMAARDMSIIRTPPPNRQPIYTEVRVFSDELIRDSIEFEVDRGGQVFFVHNRVKSLMDMAALIRKLCPDVSIAVAHGQMEPAKLERTLLGFIDGNFDVLVCTNIIETGLDIPNVNTIIIHNAHQFGLSDLHQLRGRVGRSNRKAYCYLFTPPMSALTSEARKRLRTLEDFSELGSGFHIAMRDLDIRGAGNLLGGEQSGFISEIGYETYQKILNEAITELKENEFRELFKKEIDRKQEYVHDVQIDTDVEMLLPDSYVTNIQERLNLYTELDSIEDEKGIESFRAMLVDRFGDIPSSSELLFVGLRMRWIGKKLGFSRIIYKNRKFRAFFVQNAQSPYFESAVFQALMQCLATDGKGLGVKLKESRNKLMVFKDKVNNIDDAYALLHKIQETVFQYQSSNN